VYAIVQLRFCLCFQGRFGRVEVLYTSKESASENFFILTRKGALGLGNFSFHEWHKAEKENILKAVGMKVEYGEELNVGEYRGTFRTVNDKEHVEMIRLYIEEGLSYEKIAEQLGRSSRTPLMHIQRYNKDVERSSFCPVCNRVKNRFETLLVDKI